MVNLYAQMSIEEINHRLETRPYFRLGFDYNTVITLPDSVQEKFAKALNREIPEKVLDSMLTFTPEQINRTFQEVQQECRGDSVCIQEQYQKYVDKYRTRYAKMYSSDVMPTIVILTAGNWHIKKAIPVLKRVIGNTKYDQPSVYMALAKLGDDSAKQSLMEKYTLCYVLKNSKLDTINDENLIYEYELKHVWPLREGIECAMYLKNKEMLLNILDLIYIKGKSLTTIGESNSYDYYVSRMVCDIYIYSYFRAFPNYDIFEKICINYTDAIWDLSYKNKLNKKEKKKMEILLSTEYRTKNRNQLRDWINENVNFEE
jgi:uncharacterized protein